jgi:hypothetical protein
MNFPIRCEPWVRPVLGVLGVNAHASAVTLEPTALRVHFGYVDERIPLSAIAKVELHSRQLPWWQRSFGWRTDFVSKVAYLGASRDIVKLTFNRPVPLRVLWKVNATTLLLSMDSPDRFIAAMHDAVAAQ